MEYEFKLAVNLDPSANGPTFTSICAFPWKETSIKTLWGGELDVRLGQTSWRETCRTFGGYLAAGTAQGEIYVYDMLDEVAPRLVLEIPPPPERRGTTNQSPPPPEPINCLTWSLVNTSPYDPILVWAQSAVICAFEFGRNKPSIQGMMRGHGGTITSLISNPVWPNLVMSTSQDHTSRIWDLGMKPLKVPSNPIWPGLKPPTLAGAPHGLQASEPESHGTGACVALLSGGLGGGHESAVLSGAWHPGGTPLVATCGTDRCVKIWQIPEFEMDEDETARMVTALKPIFSSNELHAARVSSISWLAEDLLITHSAPALMPKQLNKKDWDNRALGDLVDTPGTLCVWKWLSYKRYFPPVSENYVETNCIPRDDGNATGPQADYEDNSSFLIICELAIPLESNILCVHTTGNTVPFLVVQSWEQKPALFSLADILSKEQHLLGGHNYVPIDAGESLIKVPQKRPFSSNSTPITSLPGRFKFQSPSAQDTWGTTPDGTLVYAGGTNGRILVWVLT